MSASHNQSMLSSFIGNFTRGFLPVEDPLLRLPEDQKHELNILLNKTIENLPTLIKEKWLRKVIDEFDKKYIASPYIHIDHFDPREVNNALMMLTMLTQAYLWEDPASTPARSIPRFLSVNIYKLLTYNPRVPVLTYADYVLQNWRRKDKNGGITLDNVEPIYTFTISPEEAWFIKIHVVVEAAFAKAIEAAYKIHKLARLPYEIEDENAIFSRYFAEMAQSIELATEVLGRMYEHCSPSFFFNVLRPFLEGTDKAGGIFFTGRFEGAVSYRGSSGAQSSTVPALDAILGVKHTDDRMTRSLQAFIEYMPKLHQDFIFAMQNNFIPDSDERRQAIGKLCLFRRKHLEMPAEYIAKEAAKKGIPPEQVTGTGSTNIGMFLSKRARRTCDAAIMNGGILPVAKL